MLNKARKSQRRTIWSKELNNLIRGASGGFLFGIPLLYTMEVWWIGSYTEAPRMLAAIAFTFVVVFLLIRTAGFRQTANNSFWQSAMDSIEAMAIGIVCTTGILILLQEITLSTSLGEALGKIITESVPFAIGVALAHSFLRGNRYQTEDDPKKTQTSKQTNLNATLKDIGATLIGATIIAFNIAPTDEIAMLAAAVSPFWLLAIIVVSLLISYGIVFEAGFINQQKRLQQQGIFQRPLSETVASYLVSLMAATFMLWFFQQLQFEDPWQMWLSYILLLGLPATVGGAAGRILA